MITTFKQSTTILQISHPLPPNEKVPIKQWYSTCSECSRGKQNHLFFPLQLWHSSVTMLWVFCGVFFFSFTSKKPRAYLISA